MTRWNWLLWLDLTRQYIPTKEVFEVFGQLWWFCHCSDNVVVLETQLFVIGNKKFFVDHQKGVGFFSNNLTKTFTGQVVHQRCDKLDINFPSTRTIWFKVMEAWSTLSTIHLYHWKRIHGQTNKRIDVLYAEMPITNNFVLVQPCHHE